MVRDAVFESFLERQAAEAWRISESSPIVSVLPIDRQHYLLRFRCVGLVLDAAGVPRRHDDFTVGIFFPPDYVRIEPHPREIVHWLGPESVWHPNVKPPFVCTGHIAPGEDLIDLTYRLFEIITFHRATPHHALNPAASQWVRRHRDELPLDRRPLLPRAVREGARS
jgi:hypothetical protein